MSGGSPAPAGTARLVLLGGFEFHDRNGPLDVTASVSRLLAYLALQSGPRSRSQVAGALWPDVREEQARTTLRSTIWRLHQLPTDPLVRSPTHVRLAEGVEVDARSEMALTRQLVRPDAVVPLRELEAAQLGRCLLPGWSDDWVIIAREQLHQLQLHGLEALADRLLSHGCHGAAAEAALDAVRLDPLRETPYRALVRIYLDEANLVEALRCYSAFRELVHDELGAVPSERFDALLRPHLPIRTTRRRAGDVAGTVR